MHEETKQGGCKSFHLLWQFCFFTTFHLSNLGCTVVTIFILHNFHFQEAKAFPYCETSYSVQPLQQSQPVSSRLSPRASRHSTVVCSSGPNCSSSFKLVLFVSNKLYFKPEILCWTELWALPEPFQDP